MPMYTAAVDASFFTKLSMPVYSSRYVHTYNVNCCIELTDVSAIRVPFVISEYEWNWCIKIQRIITFTIRIMFSKCNYVCKGAYKPYCK